MNALRPFELTQWQWITHRALKKAKVPSPFFDPHPFYDHIKAPEVIELFGDKKFNSFFSFAFVRNPWDWQVSLYKYALGLKTHHQHELVKQMGSFDEYIRWRCDNQVRYQKDFIYSQENKLLVNYVGRFENLETDFHKICSHIGVSTSLPKLNVSNTKPYREFYNDETRELVRTTFKPDIDLLKYDF